MRKSFTLLFVVCFAVLVCSLVPVHAGSNPKATGDATFINTYGVGNPESNINFNAINTTPNGLDAKGSLIYTDPNITYTMDVKYLKVSGNTAWIAGTVSSLSVTGTSDGCCIVGNWVFYKVVDNGEPGIGQDQVWGEDLTKGEGIADSTGALAKVMGMAPPASPAFTISDGNIQVHKN